MRERVAANRQIDEFIENYDKRSWGSRAYQSADGSKVIVLTHPGRADWTAPEADPTAMIRRVIKA